MQRGFRISCTLLVLGAVSTACRNQTSLVHGEPPWNPGVVPVPDVSATPMPPLAPTLVARGGIESLDLDWTGADPVPEAYEIRSASTPWATWSPALPDAQVVSSLPCCSSSLAGIPYGTSMWASVEGVSAGGVHGPPSSIQHAHPRGWARMLGTPANEVAESLAVAGTNLLYVSGYTSGALGGSNAGFEDAFLARYDQKGNRLWLSQWGTTGHDWAVGVVVATDGTVVVTGATSGDLAGSHGGFDAFLTRIDATGAPLWTRQFGSNGAEDGYGLALSPDGSIYVCGPTSGSFAAPNAGDYDAFLAKFDPSGNAIWTKQFGTAQYDNAFRLAVDASTGDILVGGETRGSLGAANAGDLDPFIARFDADGNQLWVRQFGSSGADRLGNLTLDPAGNAVAIGTAAGGFDGHPSHGGLDAWIVRLDGAGTEILSAQVGGAGDESGQSIRPEPSGLMHIAGRIREPGMIESDVWRATLATSGALDLSAALPAPSTDEVTWAAAESSDGDLFLVGTSAAVAPGAGLWGHPIAGGNDGFVLRFDAPGTD